MTPSLSEGRPAQSGDVGSTSAGQEVEPGCSGTGPDDDSTDGASGTDGVRGLPLPWWCCHCRLGAHRVDSELAGDRRMLWRRDLLPGLMPCGGSTRGVSLFSIATDWLTTLAPATDRAPVPSGEVYEVSTCQSRRLLVPCPAACDLPHALVEWATMLIVAREGDRRCKLPPHQAPSSLSPACASTTPSRSSQPGSAYPSAPPTPTSPPSCGSAPTGRWASSRPCASTTRITCSWTAPSASATAWATDAPITPTSTGATA